MGGEPAAVEVTPGPLLSMVVGREFMITLRARPADPSRMSSPHVDPSILDGQFAPAHLPGWLETQQLTVELGIAHDSILPPMARSSPHNHPRRTRKRRTKQGDAGGGTPARKERQC